PTRVRTRSAGLRTTDHFFGESGPDAYWSLARTLRQLRALPPGTSEFMTHPGWCDTELSYSRYGRQREVELVGLGSPAARAAAIGIGVPAIVDAVHGVVGEEAHNVPDLAGVPLARLITERFGIPAFVDNDVNALALAEWRFGAGRGARSLVVLAPGTGFGSGI